MFEVLVHERFTQMAQIVDEYVENKSVPIIVNLESYMKKVESSAAIYDEKEANKVKGDMFEILACVFFHRFGDEHKVALNNYKPIALSEDFGVDGIGTNAAGTEVAVQVKYRHNPLDLITYGDIAKTFSAGTLIHKLDLTKNNSIYVFTSSKDVTAPCKEVFGARLRVINKDIIETYIDENKNFWANYLQTIYDILQK